MSLNLDELEKVARDCCKQMGGQHAAVFAASTVLALIARIREIEEGDKGSSQEREWVTSDEIQETLSELAGGLAALGFDTVAALLLKTVVRIQSAPSAGDARPSTRPEGDV